jgi:hypothetical protein
MASRRATCHATHGSAEPRRCIRRTAVVANRLGPESPQADIATLAAAPDARDTASCPDRAGIFADARPASARDEQQRSHHDRRAAECAQRCRSRCDPGAGPRAIRRSERRFADNQQPRVSAAARSIRQSWVAVIGFCFSSRATQLVPTPGLRGRRGSLTPTVAALDSRNG